MDETTCMVALARHIVAQLLAQSCGKCTPCREGLHAAASTLKRITDGGGREDDLALLENLSVTLETGSACQFGVWAANPLRSALAQFREEFIEHARGRRCRAGACAVAP